MPVEISDSEVVKLKPIKDASFETPVVKPRFFSSKRLVPKMKINPSKISIEETFNF